VVRAGRKERRIKRAQSALQARILGELSPEDKVLAQGPVVDPSLPAEAYLVVTDDEFLMAYLNLADLDSVMRVPFDKVFDAGQKPGSVALGGSSETR
jgi:hypothetical protein